MVMMFGVGCRARRQGGAQAVKKCGAAESAAPVRA
jgi:hypothetical protein